ncbi:uncharacterized protein PEZ65_020522 [Lycodopsis pacificus]
MSFGHSLNCPDAHVCCLDEEVLPEITLLDDTCDSPLPGRMPATPVTAESMNGRFTSLQLSSSTDYTTAEIPCPQEKTLDLLKSNLSSPKAESKTFNAKPSRQNDTVMSETSSSASAEEDSSEVHNPELSKHNSTTSTDSNDKMFDPPESVSYPEQWLDVRYFPEITLLEITRDSELSSVEATQESILENSMPSPEHSGSNLTKSQTSAEETSDSHPSNVTTDMSSSSVVSVRCAALQFSTSDMQCNTSSKNVTSELHGEPLVTSNAVEANDEEPPASHVAELSSKETQPSPKTSVSVNGTLTSPQNSSTDSNTPAQIPCPKNTTLDLHPSNESSPKAESEATDQATSVSDNAPETSLVISQNVSAVKATGSSAVWNTAFERRSLQKACANSSLGDAGAATSCLQNTFDAKPLRQNGTITLSETSSSDGRQNTFDKSTPLKGCDATSSPNENNSVAPTLEHNGSFSRTDPNTRMVDTPESVSEVNPAVEEVSGAGQRDTKDQSQSSLSLTDGLSDTLSHQNMDVENTSNPFNLDDTRDLRADPLITSTPMTTCKILSVNTQREGGKTTAAQKRLYGDGLKKPGRQLPSDVPSNIVCDRKTFLTHIAAKSHLPPSRAASQLLRDKTGSAPSGRFDALTSGLPMKRQRTQTAPGEPQTTGTSSSHKLRASTTGSKQPNSGLQRPQVSGVLSGTQRAATGLRLPSVRSNASSHGLRGPTATNPVTSQAKKHPLSRGDYFPAGPKRKRIDALASTSAEMSTSCGAVSRARALKLSASSHRGLLTKAKDCANCLVLEQQLKEKSAEIERLKEELLK